MVFDKYRENRVGRVTSKIRGAQPASMFANVTSVRVGHEGPRTLGPGATLSWP